MDLGLLIPLLSSEFQNRKANASLTSSSLGNPFRTLPKGAYHTVTMPPASADPLIEQIHTP